MTDDFESFAPGLTAPASRAAAITPDDNQDLARFTRALNVSASGTVRVTTVEGDIAVVQISAGCAFPVRVRRVWATGTTASGIVGLS